MAKIYLASSWRNTEQPKVLRMLCEAGHDVYDFRNPAPGNIGFSWKDVALPSEFTFSQYKAAIEHPVAEHGFNLDFNALKWADVCVLLLPCGRSAHLEAGWMIGAGKRTFIVGDIIEPELMYKMADGIFLSINPVINALIHDK